MSMRHQDVLQRNLRRMRVGLLGDHLHGPGAGQQGYP
jgi:hypothetical protein